MKATEYTSRKRGAAQKQGDGYDTNIPFGVAVDAPGISTSSDVSRSFAEGTAADAAAPKAV